MDIYCRKNIMKVTHDRYTVTRRTKNIFLKAEYRRQCNFNHLASERLEYIDKITSGYK
jgi:hypothetical protein